MTTTATSASSSVSANAAASGSTRRPLVHQRQISFLALPPLLIPSVQPPSSPLSHSHPNLQTSTPPAPKHTSQQQYSHSSLASSPRPPRPSTPVSTYHPPPTTSSILNPPQRPTQGSSLIAHLQQHQLHQQQQKRLLSTSTPKMSSDEQVPEIITRTRAAASGQPGEQVEPRQTLPSEDMEPNPSKSIPLPPNRQKLIDDIIALYSCAPTIERVARYAPACVYDDQFVYANGEFPTFLQTRKY